MGGLSLSCPIFVIEKSCCTFGEKEVEGSEGGPVQVHFMFASIDR